ncbi:MAG TPA: polysaccharide deacetylase family protein [Anaerolineales bacterium]|nr:polysaccharide deacetylase family protein [Anaerolineales bacterium]
MKLIASSLNQYYRAMQRKYPKILWHGDEARCEIAITFDDGPHPRDTPQVLEALARHDIQASFFLIGKAVEGHSDLVGQIHQNGHQTGIHCYRHRPFPFESPAALRAQLEHTARTIAEISAIHPETIRDLRPPYGLFNRPTLSRLIAWGYRLVMWNNIPPHWMQPLPWTIQQTLEQAQPGSVIVLHDGHGHGANAAKIVDEIVPRLKDQGYQFVTIESMQRNRAP